MLKRLTLPSSPIGSDHDLKQLWLCLRDPWRPPGSRISCIVFDSEQAPRPHTVDIDVMPTPEPERLAMILDVLTDMVREVAPGGSVALQYVSHCSSARDATAHAWLDLIVAELQRRELDRWPVFAGNGSEVWRAPEIANSMT